MGMRGTRGGTPTKPKHTEESIQQALYWNHPILTKPAFEMVGFIFYAWESDYLAISKAGYVYECEIKISHSDFLNEAIHKQNKMRILQGLSASDGTIDDRRPNYFWYVCPEGIISEAECPKFAGLMYITDSGTFRCIKSAPCLHKAKINLITLDENTGAERKKAIYILVQASDLNQAAKNLAEGMRGTVSDYEVASIVKTPIVDAYKIAEK